MTILTLPVVAYDDKHLAQLLNGPRAANVSRLIQNGLVTTDSAILIHAMFTEQDSTRSGFRSHSELRGKALSRESLFRDYVSMERGTIFSTHDSSAAVARPQTERLGVASAVLTMNELLGITEADWERIPESSLQPTLDFGIRASDGSHIITVEAKGTIAESPTLRSSGSTSHAKTSIEEKKAAFRSGPRSAADEAYGVITAIGRSPDTPPAVYLLDPPVEPGLEDPQAFRLLNRLEYYLQHLGLISRFSMLIALRNRLGALRRIGNINILDKESLVRADGGRFFAPAITGGGPFIEVEGVIGRVLLDTARTSNNETRPSPFVGFAREIFDVVASQDFARITQWRWTSPLEYSRPIRLPSVGREDDQHRISGHLTFGVNSAGLAYGSFTPKIVTQVSRRQREAEW